MENKIKRSGVAASSEEQLAPHESLFIWRKRKGYNQTEAAEIYEVAYFRYKLMEYGKVHTPKVRQKYTFSQLSLKEKCIIYRKRSGKTQKQISKETGVSRNWIRQQESGDVSCEKLLKFWENHEYYAKDR